LALIRINICDDTFAYSNKVLHTTTASQFVWFISLSKLFLNWTIYPKLWRCNFD